MRKLLFAVMAISLFVTACEKNSKDDKGGDFISETVAM
jgi:hypothetical protein